MPNADARSRRQDLNFISFTRVYGSLWTTSVSLSPEATHERTGHHQRTRGRRGPDAVSAGPPRSTLVYAARTAPVNYCPLWWCAEVEPSSLATFRASTCSQKRRVRVKARATRMCLLMSSTPRVSRSRRTGLRIKRASLNTELLIEWADECLLPVAACRRT